MDQSNQPVGYEVPPPSLPTSTMAIVSLVAALTGFSIFPVIGTTVALVTGYMARKETRSVPPTASGDGMATAGIIMGWIQVGLVVLSICCFVIWFVFIGGMAVFGAGQ